MTKNFLDNLDPKKAKEFDQVIKAVFEALQKDSTPKMFSCAHCGGFHSFNINCKNCGDENKSQIAFSIDRPDKMFAFALCNKCLSVSMAVFKCHGLDPSKKELQELYAENAKAQNND